MANFYDEWLAVGPALQEEFRRAPHVARDKDIPWIETRQDARVKLMMSEELGYSTPGSNVLKAEIPIGWHTGRHRHGEESMHILQGEGFSIVDGQRFDWHQGSTIQIPYRADHQHFNTGGEPAVYISGMCFSLEKYLKIASLEQLEDCGPNDPAEIAEMPEQVSQYYQGGPRAIIHLEDAPDQTGISPLEASRNQHHYIKYLVSPENGFKAQSVAVTNVWEEPAGTHSGRHIHLEAVVYAYEGHGLTELEGREEPWEKGDVLHVPPCMWEHEHYNHSTDSYWQLRIQFGIRYWCQDLWTGYTPRRVFDSLGRPIEAGKIEK